MKSHYLVPSSATAFPVTRSPRRRTGTKRVDEACADRVLQDLVFDYAVQYASPDELPIDELYNRLCCEIWRLNPGRHRLGLPELVCPNRSRLIEAIESLPVRPLRRVRLGCLPETDWLSEDALCPDLMQLLGVSPLLAAAE